MNDSNMNDFLSHLLCLFSYQFFQSGMNEDLSMKDGKSTVLITLLWPFQYTLLKAILSKKMQMHRRSLCLHFVWKNWHVITGWHKQIVTKFRLQKVLIVVNQVLFEIINEPFACGWYLLALVILAQFLAFASLLINSTETQWYSVTDLCQW